MTPFISITLVKYSQQCSGEWNYFNATTGQGSDYVFEQFRTMSGYTTIFSAIGFIDSYNKFLEQSKAL